MTSISARTPPVNASPVEAVAAQCEAQGCPVCNWKCPCATGGGPASSLCLLPVSSVCCGHCLALALELQAVGSGGQLGGKARERPGLCPCLPCLTQPKEHRLQLALRSSQLLRENSKEWVLVLKVCIVHCTRAWTQLALVPSLLARHAYHAHHAHRSLSPPLLPHLCIWYQK